MTRRRWWTWVLMWGSLLGMWMAFKMWAPKPPWFQDTAPLSALQPIPLRPLTPLGAPTDASPLRAEADIKAWAHLDSMDLDMPRTWQLQGNARAWFSLSRFFRTLPEASQQRVEVYHWGDSQIEGRSLDPSAAKVLAIPLGRPRARLGFARCASAKHRHCGVNRRRGCETRGLWTTSGRRGPAPSLFCRQRRR